MFFQIVNQEETNFKCTPQSFEVSSGIENKGSQNSDDDDQDGNEDDKSSQNRNVKGPAKNKEKYGLFGQDPFGKGHTSSADLRSGLQSMRFGYFALIILACLMF